MRDLLLKLPHIITLIAALEVAPETEAALWRRGRGRSAAISPTHLSCDELQDLRLKRLDLIQKCLDLRTHARAGRSCRDRYRRIRVRRATRIRRGERIGSRHCRRHRDRCA